MQFGCLPVSVAGRVTAEDEEEEEFEVEDGVSDEEDKEAEGGAGTEVLHFIIHLNPFISEEVRL
jgi:hypothetical protein